MSFLHSFTQVWRRQQTFGQRRCLASGEGFTWRRSADGGIEETRGRFLVHVPEEDVGERQGSDPAVGLFDIETQRLADEVGGWGNVHLMRLAVAVLYDNRSDIFEVFYRRAGGKPD